MKKQLCKTVKFLYNKYCLYPKQNSFKISKLLEDFDEIHDKVFFLYYNNKEFHQIADQFNHKKLDYKLFAFCRRNYVTFTAMAVRRLIDRHNQSISLIKILDDLHNNSNKLSRNWFVNQFPEGDQESLFKKFFGNDLHLKKNVVSDDINKLLFFTKKIKNFANKWEAHWDKKRFQITVPNFNDLDKAVRTVIDIYKKYYYLLKQKSISF